VRTAARADDNQEDEYALDLFWHALNYRGAASEHAPQMWIELEACVERIVADAVEKALHP
jgi:hypothetical protein